MDDNGFNKIEVLGPKLKLWRAVIGGGIYMLYAHLDVPFEDWPHAVDWMEQSWNKYYEVAKKGARSEQHLIGKTFPVILKEKSIWKDWTFDDWKSECPVWEDMIPGINLMLAKEGFTPSMF